MDRHDQGDSTSMPSGGVSSSFAGHHCSIFHAVHLPAAAELQVGAASMCRFDKQLGVSGGVRHDELCVYRSSKPDSSCFFLPVRRASLGLFSPISLDQHGMGVLIVTNDSCFILLAGT